ncbi:phosphatase PAP2 family protein [Angustibacter sp. McL0619]|uniref:phosphatase PAP2 family protein n=1 Tax=Angustibacter sp. McL0619 TaxID=3415676 RepID=UPI003CE6C964
MTGLVDPGSTKAGVNPRLKPPDGSLPPAGRLAKVLAGQVLLPVAAWFVVLCGVGYLLGHQLKDAVSGEDGVNRWFAAHRTPTWNDITLVVSHLGNTSTIIIGMLVSAFIIWRLSHRLREPVALIVGVASQALVFLLTTLLIDRQRPDVPKLDTSPPTSSFPSGHTGASAALYFGLAIICATFFERRWLRVLLGVGFALIPFAVATARLYRGMHHPSDVVFGMLNGLICMLIARRALQRA